MPFLSKNAVVRISSSSPNEDTENTILVRILYIDRQSDLQFYIDLQSESALPQRMVLSELNELVALGEAQVLLHDGFAETTYSSEGAIPEKHQKRRDKNYQIIAPLVERSGHDLFLPELRGKLIRNRVDETGVHEKQIRRLLIRYWQGGQTPNALVYRSKKIGGKGANKTAGTKKRGAPSAFTKATGNTTGINITPEIETKLRRGYKRFYVQEKLALTQAYHRTLEEYFNIGFKLNNNRIREPVLPPSSDLPSLDQFRYWGDKFMDSPSRRRARDGERKYNLNNRILNADSSTEVTGPGSLYQIDSTILDIYLVSSRHRNKSVGRPTLHIVIDVFSRGIVGFHLSLESHNNYSGAAEALRISFQEKVQLCKQLGFEIEETEWPMRGLPERILADRGEMLSGYTDAISNYLGIKVENTAAYRADLKGQVERQFGMINEELIHRLPGAVKKKHERGDRDPRLDARLTLRELESHFINYVLHYNRSHYLTEHPLSSAMTNHSIEPYPNELWLWGQENLNGVLRNADSNLVDNALMARKMGSISRSGIYFNGLLYRSSHREIQQKMSEAGNRRKRIEILFDPRIVDEVYILVEANSRLEPCPLKGKYQVYQNCHWDEIQEERYSQAADDPKRQDMENRSVASFNAHFNGLLSQSLDVQKPASKAQLVNNTRSNREDERDMNRASLPRKGEQGKIDNSTGSPVTRSLTTDYVPPPKLHNKIAELVQSDDKADE